MSTRCCAGCGEVLPDGVKVTIVADRGFADCKLFYALTTELGFEYVIRLRGDVYVTNERGERRVAAAWVGAGGRARRLAGARVTDVHEWPVGAVVCVHDRKMDEPWCLVASDATVPTRALIRYYGKRWGIEAGFRDIKDMRFGDGPVIDACGAPGPAGPSAVAQRVGDCRTVVAGRGGRADRV